MDAGRDALTGGEGNDTLVGDNALTITALDLNGEIEVAAGAGLALLEVSGLAGLIDVDGERDTLEGGVGEDLLIGDQSMSLTGVTGAAASDLQLRIELEGDLIDRITLDAREDELKGGGDNDRILGDSRVQAAAMAASLGSGAQLELEMHALVDTLRVESAADSAWGEGGDDVLVGDSELSLAGLVLTGQVNGALAMDIDGVLERVTLDASRDTLDGGDGRDMLIGDQLAGVAAVLDASADPTGLGTGAVALDIHELVASLDLGADSDRLYGGAENDELLGDSRAVVAAFVGVFAGPLGSTIDLTGDRLVLDLDQRSSRDTLRGGDGEDILAGDNDLAAALATGGSGLPAGSYGMNALIRDAHVWASGDDLNGEAGDDINEHGNRAVAPRELVTKANIASLSKTNAPSEQPAIGWSRALGDLAIAGGNGAWVESFVNTLGAESNPNARIRIKL